MEEDLNIAPRGSRNATLAVHFDTRIRGLANHVFEKL